VAETPDIRIRLQNNDHLLPVSDNLTGFINNPDESRLENHMFSQNPLFYLPISENRTLFPMDQQLMDHISGAGVSTQESYLKVGYSIALDMIRYGVLTSRSNKVFDLGCGSGRVSQFIATIVEPSEGGSYTGFDTWKGGVDWASKNITPIYPHARFMHIGPIEKNGYEASEAYPVPLENQSHDVFMANSLFTHLRQSAAEYYLSEVSRVLKKSGKAYISYFASKELFHEIAPNAKYDEDGYAINFCKGDSEDQFVDEIAVENMAIKYGLKLLGKRWGHWRGQQYSYRGYHGFQDLFIFQKI